LEIGKPISQDIFKPETVARIFTSILHLWGTIEISKKHALRFISQSESEKKYLKTDIARFQLTIYAKAYKENISVTEIKEIISRYGL